MSEQTNATVETVTVERCGHETSTGPCHRPAGHSKTGHISKAALAAKSAKARGKDGSPEALAAAETIRAAKAAERIAAAEEAHALRIAKLTEAAASLGYKIVPMTAKEKAALAKGE